MTDDKIRINKITKSDGSEQIFDPPIELGHEAAPMLAKVERLEKQLARAKEFLCTETEDSLLITHYNAEIEAIK
jgi:hypothetical protein